MIERRKLFKEKLAKKKYKNCRRVFRRLIFYDILNLVMSLKTFSYLNYNLKYCLYKAIDSNNVRDIILHVCVLKEFGVLLL